MLFALLNGKNGPVFTVALALSGENLELPHICGAKHFDFERRVLLVNDRDANSSEMANTAG